MRGVVLGQVWRRLMMSILSVNTICVCVGIGQKYHFRIPVDYYPEDSVFRHQNGKFSTGELVGIEGEFGRARQAQALGKHRSVPARSHLRDQETADDYSRSLPSEVIRSVPGDISTSLCMISTLFKKSGFVLRRKYVELC